MLCDIYKLKEYLQKEFRGACNSGTADYPEREALQSVCLLFGFRAGDDMENVEELAQTIRSLGYDVYTNVEYINGMKKTLGMVQAVLGGIGAVIPACCSDWYCKYHDDGNL